MILSFAVLIELFIHVFSGSYGFSRFGLIATENLNYISHPSHFASPKDITTRNIEKRRRKMPASSPQSLDYDSLLQRSNTLFDRSFVVEPVIDPSQPADAPATKYRAVLSTGWIGGNNRLIGSYVYCTALRAMLAYSAPHGYPDPISLHTDFYSSAPGGSTVEIVLTERKRGKSYLFLNADMYLLPSADKPLLSATLSKKPIETKGPVPVISCHGVFGVLPTHGIQKLATHYKPVCELPPPDQCVDPYRALAYSRPDTIHRDPKDTSINIRDTVVQLASPAIIEPLYRKAEAVIKEGKEDNILDLASELEQWFGMKDGRKADALQVAYACDMLPVNYVLQVCWAQRSGFLPFFQVTVAPLFFIGPPRTSQIRCPKISNDHFALHPLLFNPEHTLNSPLRRQFPFQHAGNQKGTWLERLRDLHLG